MLFSMVKLPNQVISNQNSILSLFVKKIKKKQRTVVQSNTKRDDTLIDITIDLVKEICPGDDQTIQIFNIIFKKY